MVVIDDFDIYSFIRIHRANLDNGFVSTYSLAKEFFNYENVEELDAKANFVSGRLKKLSKVGLIEIKRNSRKRIFILNNDKVTFKRYKLPDGKIKDCVCIKDEKNKWAVYEI